MSRYKDDPRLLAYYDGSYEDDDYHTSNRPQISNRSKEYDMLTSKLQTGSKEYGYFQDNQSLESPKFARSHRRLGDDSTTGLPRDYESLDNKKPNFGRRSLITESKDNGRLTFSRSPAPKLPRVSRAGGSLMSDLSEYGYKPPASRAQGGLREPRMARRNRAAMTQESVRAEDIKRVDLLLTLNDNTTIEVKAVPFKPHQT